MRRLLVSLLLLLACCCGRAPFASRAVQVTYETSYRILIYCDDVMVGFGSATAVGPRNLLTARHVADPGCPTPKLVAVSAEGTEVAVTLTRVHETTDLAIVTATGRPFRVWARIATRECNMGDGLNAHVGGVYVPENLAWSFLYKRLYASGYSRTDRGTRVLELSGPIVAGNSGGGVLNDRGELVGVIVARDIGPDLRGLAIAASELHSLLD